jgi:aerobic-type carbon monoxide dehydrogenase small subunit (CoxS/CutS family)
LRPFGRVNVMADGGELGRTVRANVNGTEVSRYVANRSTLAQFLRDDLGLTGTKVSCELQVCGVCSVLVDGSPVSACTYLAVDIDGHQVETVEGLADGDTLHPLQQAFVEEFALQCGFCTPGFLMMSVALLRRNPDPSEEDVKEYLDGNICRCTGYRPIVEAVQLAATRMREDGHV